MVAKKTEEQTQSFYFVPAPFVPAWEWANDDTHEEEWKTFKANVKTLREQLESMQKSSVEATKKQWDIFFDYTSKMQETIIDALPDEAPSVPGFPPFFMPFPPKAVLKQRKEAREEANKYAKEQADSAIDYAKKRQSYAEKTISDGVKKAEEKVRKKKE